MVQALALKQKKKQTNKKNPKDSQIVNFYYECGNTYYIHCCLYMPCWNYCGLNTIKTMSWVKVACEADELCYR